MRIHLLSVLVNDQQEALRFYTEVLGWEEKTNIPAGQYAWITLVSPDGPEGVELCLEPAVHPAVAPFREAMVKDGIPWTSFAVDDLQAAHDDLSARGVRFTQGPTDHGSVITAVFDDTCGNLIQLAQEKVG